jgi:hyperosmotically inducible periplasmic protein
MFRALLRLILIVVVLVGLGAFFVGYRWGDREETVDRPVGTSGAAGDVDTSRARERGAAIGEKVATGANDAQRAMANASLTAKIKTKMTLDDSIEARNIDVDTEGSVVTLRGTVRNEAERSRAVRLARETEGVTSVVDRLSVSGR